MYLIVTSEEDVASMNIRERLLAMADWEECGEFDGSPVLAHGDFIMILIREIHLEADDLDRRIKDEAGLEPDCLIFASRHKSKSGLRTLTVHPIGNYGEAKFGGRERTVVPAAPRSMTRALLLLKRHASELDFNISFECTHHGPYLETPCFFIEIGSDEVAWPEVEPGNAIARTILDLDTTGEVSGDRVAIGVGGGHYAPRHTHLVMDRQVSIGHMIPSYALDNVDDDSVSHVIERTPGCEVVYFHRKAMNKPRYRELKGIFEEKGIRAVRSSDLDER